MNVAAILRLKGRGVVTTTKDKSLLDIAKLLEQHGIGCIVIEGDNGKVAGIVSERDLMRAIGQSGPKVLKEPVSDFMTKTVVTAREADPIDRLMSEMTTHRFRHMPVVERGRLIGLVSIGDVVKMRSRKSRWRRPRRGSTQAIARRRGIIRSDCRKACRIQWPVLAQKRTKSRGEVTSATDPKRTSLGRLLI